MPSNHSSKHEDMRMKQERKIRKRGKKTELDPFLKRGRVPGFQSTTSLFNLVTLLAQTFFRACSFKYQGVQAPLIVVRRASSSVTRLVVLAHLHLVAVRRLQAARGWQVASNKGNEIDKGDNGKRPRLANHVSRHSIVGADKRNEAEGDAGDGEKAKADKVEDGPALGLLHEVHGSQEQQGSATSHKDVNELTSSGQLQFRDGDLVRSKMGTRAGLERTGQLLTIIRRRSNTARKATASVSLKEVWLSARALDFDEVVSP